MAATGAALGLGCLIAPGHMPLGVILLGALIGAGNGLLAVGLVLTYRSHRVVNFALAGIGGLGAALAVGLHLGHGMPWPLAVAPGVLLGVVGGAASERVVLRRLERSPRLLVTVATVGLAQLFAAGQAVTPKLLGGPTLVGAFRTPLSNLSLHVEPLLISGNDLALAAVVPFVLGGLTWFLLRSDAGVAIRGIAENGERARLLGVPAHRLSLLVWALVGGLAAVAMTLRAPSDGLDLSVASSGPQVMLPALAAAVLAGLTSLPRAFAAGVGLGVLDQLVRWNFSKQSVTSVVMLVVLMVALLLRHPDRGRALGLDATWTTTTTSRPLPQAVRRLPELRVARLGWLGSWAVGLAGLAGLGSPSQLNIATIATCYAVVTVSLVVLTGWSGTVSLGQMAVLGTGATVAGDLIGRWNVDFFVAMLAGGAAGAVVALALALPALRVDGQLLAVTTLTFAVAVDTFFLNPVNFPWLVPGVIDRPVLFQRWDMNSERVLYLVAVALLACTLVVTRNLARGRTRRTMIAVRDNPRAAAAAGVDGVRSRLTAFVVCGVLSGMAGAVHATALGAVGVRTYTAGLSLFAFTTVVIGGVTSVGGALAATSALYLIVYWVPQLQLVATGVGVLLVLLLLPGGLAAAGCAVRDRFALLAARRRGIDWDQGAPSPEPVPAATAAPGRALSCRGIQASYGSHQVLFGVDLDVEPGEVVALLGTNGAGKSSLLRTLCGLLPATGEMHFDGAALRGRRTESIAAAGLALMPGGRGVFPTLTVAENLRLAAWLVRRDRAAVRKVQHDAVDLFPALEKHLDTRAGDLSGGEQQMLSLAMAMAVRPRLLCIDELSLGLAPAVVAHLVEVIREINATGVTVVVVEQSVNVALLLAERAVFLEKGQVRFTGATSGLLERPDVLRAVFLGATAAVAPRERPSPPAAGPQMTVQGLTKRFGGRAVVDEVDLVLPAGHILGLIGHNGAGKTTLLDLLSGFTVADAGTITLGDRDLTGLSPVARAEAGLGRSFQDARLYPSLTVTETLAVALDRHLVNRDPLAVALWLPVAFDVQAAVDDRVEELVAALGLSRYRDHLISELSTGTRRVVELGCVLAQAPAVVLLDEPSAGLAQRETEALVPVLRRIQADLGCAVVVVEHDLALMSELCDSLIALETGRVIATGSPAEVLGHDDVVRSYLGTDAAVTLRSGPRA